MTEKEEMTKALDTYFLPLDYFTGLAMHAILTRSSDIQVGETMIFPPSDKVANLAYKQALAMLEERKKVMVNLAVAEEKAFVDDILKADREPD